MPEPPNMLTEEDAIRAILEAVEGIGIDPGKVGLSKQLRDVKMRPRNRQQQSPQRLHWIVSYRGKQRTIQSAEPPSKWAEDSESVIKVKSMTGPARYVPMDQVGKVADNQRRAAVREEEIAEPVGAVASEKISIVEMSEQKGALPE